MKKLALIFAAFAALALTACKDGAVSPDRLEEAAKIVAGERLSV